MRLIDADDFFRQFPELDTEPYNNAPTVERIVCRSRNWSNECTHSSSFEQGYTQGYEEGKNDRPKGKWLVYKDNYGNDKPVCSCCNKEQIGYANYCSNCGADMRGDV